jgi:hypothetical protein
MERQCVCCKTKFRPDRYHPKQKYCSKASCQRKRRTAWQKNKLKTDTTYRENQADAQALWKDKNPNYWKNYRATHPEYVKRNRLKQQLRRNQKKTSQAPLLQPDVAKMDFAIVQLSILEPVTKTG